MTTSSPKESHIELSQDVLNVYEGQCTMNELLARLCEAMGNLDMQVGLIAAMQALLNDPTLVTGEEDAERPLHGT